MNTDDWNTGFDPYEELMLAKQNIQQCAIAINHGSEIMKDLANKYNHQQEVIQQLMFQNKKLHNQIENLRVQIIRQDTELQSFRTKLPQ